MGELSPNPLLDETSMKGAKAVLINITGGSDMTLLDVDHAANIIRQSVNPDANIIFGSLIDESLQGKLKISIFATGIEATGKKILYYPESESPSQTNNIQNQLNSKSQSNNDEISQEGIDEITSSSKDQSDKLDIQSKETDEIIEEKLSAQSDYKENNVNYKNLEEKKKTGFFSMLSNLMSSTDKQINNDKEELKDTEKKPKRKKDKTDPNLFLFNEVVDNSEASIDDDGLEEISQISEISKENEIEDDIDTPSYLKKGTSQ